MRARLWTQLPTPYNPALLHDVVVIDDHNRPTGYCLTTTGLQDTASQKLGYDVESVHATQRTAGTTANSWYQQWHQ